MEEIAGLLCVLERPSIFIAPFVLAHDENADGFPCGERILPAEKEVVVPGDGNCIFVVLGCCGTEVYCADFLPRACVAADGDEQPLTVARGFVSGVGRWG